MPQKGQRHMLHFSCDGCGQPLGDDRFVVRIEAYPAFDPQGLTEADADIDHLAEIAESLTGDVPIGDSSGESREFRFDLCAGCHRRFVRDPLRRDAARRVDFSKN